MSSMPPESEYEFTERYHTIMKLACAGKTHTQIAHLLKGTPYEASQDKIKRLLSYRDDQESIFYALTLLAYYRLGREMKDDNGQPVPSPIRSLPSAAHFYTKLYDCGTPKTITQVSATQITPVPATLPQTHTDLLLVLGKAEVKPKLQNWVTQFLNYSRAQTGVTFNTTLILTLYFCSILFLFVPVWVLGCPQHSPKCFTGYFSDLYAVIPLAAGVSGLIRYALRRKLGNAKALFLFSLGLMSWGVANMLWGLAGMFGKQSFLFPHIEYPSYYNVGFIINSVCWFEGLRLIYSNGQRSKYMIFTLLVVSLVSLPGLLFLIVHLHNEQITKTSQLVQILLDIAYPFIDIINAVLLLFLISKINNKRTPSLFIAIVILFFGMASSFCADLLFSTQKVHPLGSWTYSEGHLPDFLFATTFLFLGIGLWLFPLEVNGTVTQVVEEQEQ